MGNIVKSGVRLIVIDVNGVQLFSMELGGWNMDDYDSQREIGKALSEGLPGEAYPKELVMDWIVYFEDSSSRSMRGTYREVSEAYPNAIRIDEA